MQFRPLSICAVSWLILAAAPVWAQNSRDAIKQSQTPVSSSAKGRGTARGPLPDPVLLDGSSQQPEKKPEYGMLGQFEMPGDENAKDGKVGGQQNQPPGSPSGGEQNASAAQGGGAQSGATAQSGGASGGAQPQGGQQANQGAGGGAAPASNDPNGKAEGAQVAGLSGDPNDAAQGQGGAQAGDVPKPQQVALGDPTMRIKPAANAPGVVGAVTAGNTQQMESKVGGGGGGSSGAGGRNNSEKGRVMPAGL